MPAVQPRQVCAGQSRALGRWPLAGTARPGTAQVSRFAAGPAWRRQGSGVQVLEGNLRRVIGAEAFGGELRALSRQAMRWYARYWLEAFRVPWCRWTGWSGSQSTSGDPSSPGIAKPPVASQAPVFAKLPDARDAWPPRLGFAGPQARHT